MKLKAKIKMLVDKSIDFTPNEFVGELHQLFLLELQGIRKDMEDSMKFWVKKYDKQDWKLVHLGMRQLQSDILALLDSKDSI